MDCRAGRLLWHTDSTYTNVTSHREWVWVTYTSGSYGMTCGSGWWDGAVGGGSGDASVWWWQNDYQNSNPPFNPDIAYDESAYVYAVPASLGKRYKSSGAILHNYGGATTSCDTNIHWWRTWDYDDGTWDDTYVD